MKILVAGVDGYLGWSLAQHLAARGHEVAGADAFFRRAWVEEMGSWSAIPIATMEDRLAAFEEAHGRPLRFFEADLRDFDAVTPSSNRSGPTPSSTSASARPRRTR